jgi:hypothetical protein
MSGHGSPEEIAREFDCVGVLVGARLLEGDNHFYTCVCLSLSSLSVCLAWPTESKEMWFKTTILAMGIVIVPFGSYVLYKVRGSDEVAKSDVKL